MKKLVLLMLLAFSLVFLPIADATAQAPQLINYQGKLVDDNGNAIDQGAKSVVFEIYEDESGGSALWSEVKNVIVSEDGYFSTYLGQNQEIDLDFSQELWLQVTVGTNDPSSRTRLTSTPSSFYSAHADSAVVAAEAYIAHDLSPEVVNWSHFEVDATVAGGDLEGNFPNPTLRSNAVLDNIEDGSITQEKLAPNVSTSPSGPAGGDLSGTYPDPLIAVGAVKTDRIADGAITTVKIADGVITDPKLVEMDADKLFNLSALDNKITVATDATINGDGTDADPLGLADDAVTSEKIADGEVMNVDLANDAVTSGKIMDGEVMTADLMDDAVTNDKLADDAVMTNNIVNGTILTEDISDNAVDNDKLADEAVRIENIEVENATMPPADGTVLTWNDVTGELRWWETTVDTDATIDGDGTSADPLGVADGAITTVKLADDAVTGDKLADNSVSTNHIVDGQVMNADIAGDAITTDKIQDGEVTTGDLADNAVTNAKLADDAVSTAKIQDLAVTNAKINDNAVSTAKIQNEAVTIAKVGSGAQVAEKVIKSDGAGGAYWGDDLGMTLPFTGSYDGPGDAFTITHTGNAGDGSAAVFNSGTATNNDPAVLIDKDVDDGAGSALQVRGIGVQGTNYIATFENNALNEGRTVMMSNQAPAQNVTDPDGNPGSGDEFVTPDPIANDVEDATLVVSNTHGDPSNEKLAIKTYGSIQANSSIQGTNIVAYDGQFQIYNSAGPDVGVLNLASGAVNVEPALDLNATSTVNGLNNIWESADGLLTPMGTGTDRDVPTALAVSNTIGTVAGEPFITFAPDGGTLTDNREFAVDATLETTDAGVDDGDFTVGIDLANPNTWTGTQTFSAGGDGIVVTTNAQFNGNIHNSGNDVSVDDDLVPAADDTYSLGTNLMRWTDLYVSGASLHVGDAIGAEAIVGYNAGTANIDVDGVTEMTMDNATTDIPSNDFTVGANFDVDNGTGDVTTNGDAQVGTNLNVDGVTTLDQTTIDGTLTQNGAGDQVTLNGNVDATNGLDVTGATTLTGTVNQSGGQVDFNGNVDANSGLDVDGGDLNVGANFTVTNAGVLTGTAAGHSLGTAAVDANVLTIEGAVGGAFELDVNGDADISGTISAASLSMNGDIDMNENDILEANNIDGDADGLNINTLNDGPLVVGDGNVTIGNGAITTGTGQVDFNGNVDANLGLDVTGANFTAGTTTIDPSNGNTVIGGTLTATSVPGHTIGDNTDAVQLTIDGVPTSGGAYDFVVDGDVDINGGGDGDIDGTVIGAANPAAGDFTNLTAQTDFTINATAWSTTQTVDDIFVTGDLVADEIPVAADDTDLITAAAVRDAIADHSLQEAYDAGNTITTAGGNNIEFIAGGAEVLDLQIDVQNTAGDLTLDDNIIVSGTSDLQGFVSNSTAGAAVTVNDDLDVRGNLFSDLAANNATPLNITDDVTATMQDTDDNFEIIGDGGGTTGSVLEVTKNPGGDAVAAVEVETNEVGINVSNPGGAANAVGFSTSLSGGSAIGVDVVTTGANGKGVTANSGAGTALQADVTSGIGVQTVATTGNAITAENNVSNVNNPTVAVSNTNTGSASYGIQVDNGHLSVSSDGGTAGIITNGTISLTSNTVIRLTTGGVAATNITLAAGSLQGQTIFITNEDPGSIDIATGTLAAYSIPGEEGMQFVWNGTDWVAIR